MPKCLACGEEDDIVCYESSRIERGTYNTKTGEYIDDGFEDRELIYTCQNCGAAFGGKEIEGD